MLGLKLNHVSKRGLWEYYIQVHTLQSSVHHTVEDPETYLLDILCLKYV